MVDASTTVKGKASFNATDFDVASGVVTIDDNNTVRTVVAGEGIDVSSASGNPTISGENATTTNKGIASFNTNDFSVSSGAVSLKNKTSYLSIPGTAFQAEFVDHNYSVSSGKFNANATIGNGAQAPVMLPHGAIVTAVVVRGNDVAETWTLFRTPNDDGSGANIMATANIDSTDSSISNATIDNQNQRYWLQTSALDSADDIYGATITYTTDYD